MRNKILTSVIIIVIFSTLIATTSFMLLINLQQVKNTKEELRNFNLLISESSINKPEQLEQLKNIKINNVQVRVTLIDFKGNVLFDNEKQTNENHLGRTEVKEAIKNGEGYATRYSDTIKTKFMYYASKINDNLIIRTSVPIITIKILQEENIKYYILILTIVMVFSVLLALRLVKIIVDPVKNLESVTLKMTHGDYKIRANIKTNDELGILGDSFNNMADQLQIKMDEVVEKQTKLEAILKSMDSGVVAIDNNNNVMSINPSAQMLLGIKRNVLGECLADCITDYDINSFLGQEEEVDKQIKVLHPIERDLKIKKSDIVNGTEKIGTVITFQDITDMKRVELMRTQFVANVSHELKTPLTSIKGFAETLKYVKDDETREKFLDIIDKESERLTRLINDILVLSNIESNLAFDVHEFVPKTILKDVLDMVKKIAVNKNIDLQYEDKNNEFILGDKDKFYQLGLNLIENAIKYSKESGYVKVVGYGANGYYCLEVIDNGVGIPDEDIPRIFERFYRVDKSRKQGGTGLGLAIVKHIVKTFNGTITVESEFGKGSMFKVKIPLV